MKRTSRKLSPQTKQKIREANTGKIKTDEAKKKISDALKAYWATIPQMEGDSNK